MGIKYIDYEKKKKPVRAIWPNGKYKDFESIIQASKETGLAISTISNSIRNDSVMKRYRSNDFNKREIKFCEPDDMMGKKLIESNKKEFGNFICEQQKQIEEDDRKNSVEGRYKYVLFNTKLQIPEIVLRAYVPFKSSSFDYKSDLNQKLLKKLIDEGKIDFNKIVIDMLTKGMITVSGEFKKETAIGMDVPINILRRKTLQSISKYELNAYVGNIIIAPKDGRENTDKDKDNKKQGK